MSDNPKPSPIKIGDVLLIVRHPDDSAPMEFDVDHVSKKWATGSIGLLSGGRQWRVDIVTMKVYVADAPNGPSNFVVLRSWEEWDAMKAGRAERQDASVAWIRLRTELGGRCPDRATAANIQAARVLLGLSDQASHDRADA